MGQQPPNSLELYAYLYSLQYSSQYIHKNIASDKRVIIFAIDKHFGLVEKGQSLLLGNTSNRQQDRKVRTDVALKRVRVTIVAVDKQ